MVEQMIDILGGLFAGDLVGSAHEGKPGQEGRDLICNESRLTDDSILAAVTAKTLMREDINFINAPKFAKAYRDCILRPRNKSAGFSPDMRMWANGSIDGGFMEGNGAGVRAAAVALTMSNKSNGLRFVEMCVRITHSEEATAMALIFADLIFDLKAGCSERMLLDRAEMDLPMVSIYNANTYREQSMDTTLWWTLPAAIHIGLTANSYKTIFNDILSIGGDTDSIGAMAGAIGHARWGMQAMPRRIKQRLKGEAHGLFVGC